MSFSEKIPALEPPSGFSGRDLYRLLLVDVIAKLALDLASRVYPVGLSGLVWLAIAARFAVFAYLARLVGRRDGGWREIGFRSAGRAGGWLGSLAAYAAFFPVFLWLGMVNRDLLEGLFRFLGWTYVPRPQISVILMFSDEVDFAARAALACFAIFGAPFIEETMFRGVGMNALLKTGSAWRAAIWTGILFGVFHFESGAVIPLSAFGVVLGVSRVLGKSLFCPVFLHFLHNLAVLLLLRHHLA